MIVLIGTATEVTVGLPAQKLAQVLVKQSVKLPGREAVSFVYFTLLQL